MGKSMLSSILNNCKQASFFPSSDCLAMWPGPQDLLGSPVSCTYPPIPFLMEGRKVYNKSRPEVLKTEGYIETPLSPILRVSDWVYLRYRY